MSRTSPETSRARRPLLLAALAALAAAEGARAADTPAPGQEYLQFIRDRAAALRADADVLRAHAEHGSGRCGLDTRHGHRSACQRHRRIARAHRASTTAHTPGNKERYATSRYAASTATAGDRPPNVVIVSTSQ